MFHPTKDFINICEDCKEEFPSEDTSMHHLCYPCWRKQTREKELFKQFSKEE